MGCQRNDWGHWSDERDLTPYRLVCGPEAPIPGVPMPITVPPSGPADARVMVVAEAPSSDDEARGQLFSSTPGMELDRMLHEGGIMRSECFVTSLSKSRPLGDDMEVFIAKSKKQAAEGGYTELKGKWVKQPIVDGFQALLKEIHLIKPNLIIAFGSASMWALTGRWGIMKHRGSMLYATPPFPKIKVIPTFSPSYILRDWAARTLAVNDLKRAGRYRNGEDYPIPNWSFLIRPSIDSVIERLSQLTRSCEISPLWIDFDLETKSGHIDCAGISWSRTEALCIPFMSAAFKSGYWTEDEEASIIWHLRRLLTHPNCWVRGQNLLYDCQYTYRHWHFIPNVRQDTMISQHVLFAGMKKSLDFQASLYCDYYVQWKPDKAVWAEGK